MKKDNKMEIPKYIKLDFLMVIMGIGIMAFAVYFLVNKDIDPFTEKHVIIVLSMFLGGIFLLLGMHEMVKNYNRDSELEDLYCKVKKKEFNVKYLKLEKEEKKLKSNFKPKKKRKKK